MKLPWSRRKESLPIGLGGMLHIDITLVKPIMSLMSNMSLIAELFMKSSRGDEVADMFNDIDTILDERCRKALSYLSEEERKQAFVTFQGTEQIWNEGTVQKHEIKQDPLLV